MKPEFLPLGRQDHADGINLKARILDDDGIVVAHVLRLTPSVGRFGDPSERRFVCSCWRSAGLSVERTACPHILLVEAAIQAATPRPAA